jgi:hypothetical protein
MSPLIDHKVLHDESKFSKLFLYVCVKLSPLDHVALLNRRKDHRTSHTLVISLFVVKSNMFNLRT